MTTEHFIDAKAAKQFRNEQFELVRKSMEAHAPVVRERINLWGFDVLKEQVIRLNKVTGKWQFMAPYQMTPSTGWHDVAGPLQEVWLLGHGYKREYGFTLNK